MTAWYNEPDLYAAQWLENLIAAGHIAPGIVDRRPIQEIEAYELAGFTQCHFFAGIGIWSHALRRAGWKDDWPIWTGSCPCQPFSNAGKQKGFDDDRHLWPYWFALIEQCHPSVIVGEQVASKDGLQWFDLVSSDLESADYACGAADLCAAGISGAHIRQRLYFVGVADMPSARRVGSFDEPESEAWDKARLRLPSAECDNEWVADDNSNGRNQARQYIAPSWNDGFVGDSAASGLADDDDARSQGWAGMPECRNQRFDGQSGLVGGVAHSSQQSGERFAGSVFGTQAEVGGEGQFDGNQSDRHSNGGAACEHSRLLHSRKIGSFDDADWLLCRNPVGEPAWRPVESGTFPLDNEAISRVGRLRAYGNALDTETAILWCETLQEIGI